MTLRNKNIFSVFGDSEFFGKNSENEVGIFWPKIWNGIGSGHCFTPDQLIMDFIPDIKFKFYDNIWLKIVSYVLFLFHLKLYYISKGEGLIMSNYIQFSWRDLRNLWEHQILILPKMWGRYNYGVFKSPL